MISWFTDGTSCPIISLLHWIIWNWIVFWRHTSLSALPSCTATACVAMHQDVQVSANNPKSPNPLSMMIDAFEGAADLVLMLQSKWCGDQPHSFGFQCFSVFLLTSWKETTYIHVSPFSRHGFIFLDSQTLFVTYFIVVMVFVTTEKTQELHKLPWLCRVLVALCTNWHWQGTKATKFVLEETKKLEQKTMRRTLQSFPR